MLAPRPRQKLARSVRVVIPESVSCVLGPTADLSRAGVDASGSDGRPRNEMMRRLGCFHRATRGSEFGAAGFITSVTPQLAGCQASATLRATPNSVEPSRGRLSDRWRSARPGRRPPSSVMTTRRLSIAIDVALGVSRRPRHAQRPRCGLVRDAARHGARRATASARSLESFSRSALSAAGVKRSRSDFHDHLWHSSQAPGRAA